MPLRAHYKRVRQHHVVAWDEKDHGIVCPLRMGFLYHDFRIVA